MDRSRHRIAVLRATFGLVMFGFVILLSIARPAEAHPHAWVDVRSGLVFDDDGRIAAIEEEWFFDYLYTALVKEQLSSEDGLSQDILDELARTNLESLADYDYFTVVTVDDTAVAIAQVTDYETGMRDDRLWMKFRVPLAEPIDPGEHAVSYSIYDPSYYVEMLHIEGDPIVLTGGAPQTCSALVEAAHPSFDEVALAAAFDQTQTGPANLGSLFAEWVHVSCE